MEKKLKSIAGERRPRPGRPSHIKLDEVFNCKSINSFAETIIQTLPYRGFSNSRFYLCEVNSVRFLTKLCFYRKTPAELYGGDTRGTIPQTDAEIQILEYLRENIIKRNISPCILEIIYARVCGDISKLVPKQAECERIIVEYSDHMYQEDPEQLLCKYQSLITGGLAHNKCAFIVLEKCDIPLDEYIKRAVNFTVYMAIFKSLLFMIIYTVWAIDQVSPGFRHYDLHTDNIMLKFDPDYKFDASSPRYLVFTISGKKFYVPYFGIIPKIIDFGFSVLPREKIISNFTRDKVQMYYRVDHDLLFLFHHIYNTTITHTPDKLEEIDSILRELDPYRTYVHYYTEYIRKIDRDIPSVKDMLDSKLFSGYMRETAPDGELIEFDSPE